jgi:PadR family transcriptional regulator, regulatory protein PadR
MRESNSSFMNGVPELLILKVLSDREMYGYELLQEIRERTETVVSLGEGVVYPILHGLEKSGALRSRRMTVQGRSRVYYSLTPKGLTRLSDLSSIWSRLTAAIQQVVAGGSHVGAI